MWLMILSSSWWRNQIFQHLWWHCLPWPIRINPYLGSLKELLETFWMRWKRQPWSKSEFSPEPKHRENLVSLEISGLIFCHDLSFFPKNEMRDLSKQQAYLISELKRIEIECNKILMDEMRYKYIVLGHLIFQSRFLSKTQYRNIYIIWCSCLMEYMANFIGMNLIEINYAEIYFYKRIHP